MAKWRRLMVRRTPGCRASQSPQVLQREHKFGEAEMEYLKSMVRPFIRISSPRDARQADEAFPTSLHDWAFIPALKVGMRASRVR